jgi:hypothetical protein
MRHDKVKSKVAVAQIDFMLGRSQHEQRATIRPEPVEGQTVGLGNSP